MGVRLNVTKPGATRGRGRHMRGGDTDPTGTPTYDYVVVGSGAGGGPLAANLARAGMSVLLLEAGGDHEGLTYQVPAFHGLATEDEGLRWDYFVRHYTDMEQQRRDNKFVPERDGVLYPRAGTLGGCTAHNAMITVYPHNRDWDEIARVCGDRSWRSAAMRKYFQRLERYAIRPRRYPRNRLLASIIRLIPILSDLFGNRGRHGFSGWLGTSLPDPRLAFGDSPLLRIIFAAAKQTLTDFLNRPLTPLEGLNYLDPNDWRVVSSGPQGLWLTPLATRAGRRNGTREYVRAVERQSGTLAVKTNALVARVLFDDANTAIGVEYLEGEHLYRADPGAAAAAAAGEARQALVTREVILSAGAFNTPQILKLSGVGPRVELDALSIPVRVDLPGVGENLQDRYEVGVITEMPQDFPLLRSCAFQPPRPGDPPDQCYEQWQAARGPYTTNGVVISIIKRSKHGGRHPDLFIFGLPAFFEGYYPGYSRALLEGKNFFTWAILKSHTRNTAGSVTLRSTDPRDVAAINFRYFEEGSNAGGEDLEAMVEGVTFVRQMMAQMGGAMGKEVLPGPDVTTPAAIRQFVRDKAWGHHASCTCKMGREDDPLAVVDSRFRVHGTRNLRVVDASVFPAIPGFFIVTAIYMISEKASEEILADASPVTTAVRSIVRRAGGAVLQVERQAQGVLRQVERRGRGVVQRVERRARAAMGRRGPGRGG